MSCKRAWKKSGWLRRDGEYFNAISMSGRSHGDTRPPVPRGTPHDLRNSGNGSADTQHSNRSIKTIKTTNIMNWID
ncbi:hypothetical protein DLM45_03985 [Hyphomicrobium methylovorum]|nr:hypothetical protein [Hyphomicrobium methylovorum]